MRNKSVTRDFYLHQLGFTDMGLEDYDGYLMVRKDQVEIHFFEFPDLDPALNYGQVYIRTNAIDDLYGSLLKRNVQVHPSGKLQIKSWGQKEFSLLDPDNNLLTFGEAV